MTSKKKFRINKIATLLVFLVFSGSVLAQAPRISSVEPQKGPAGTLVTITGDGFPTDMTKVVVRFGAAVAAVESTSANVMEVRVPPGATYRSVSITNLDNHLIGYSTQPFLLSYGGDTFSAANLTTPTDFPTVSELFDICLCDFDGDRKVDVASATLTNPQPYIFKNTSTGNTPTFTAQRFTVPGVSKAITCADLNGDGKPEMLITRGDQISNSFFVLQNNSSPGSILFSTNVQSYFSAEERPVNRIAVRDLDGDGKPEVIVTNTFDNTLYIFKNESTASTVSLNTIPQPVSTLPAGTESFDIEAVDVNRDGKPDLVISPFNKANIYIALNTTTALNNFTFENAVTITVPGKFREMVMAEVNGDNIPDFVISNSSEGKIHIGTNTSSGNTLSFSWSDISSNQPFSLDAGDLNGDGLGDVLASNLSGTDMKVLINTTVPPSTTPTFSETLLSADAVADPSVLFTRQTKIGDVSGDGKPDLLFTTWDNTFSKYNLSVIRNMNCVEPVLRPEGPITVCSGQTITFSATPALEATYVWKLDGVDIGAPSESTYDYVVDGSSPKLTVEVVSEGGACTILSNEVALTFDAGAAPPTPTLTDPNPACEGSNVTLTGPAPLSAGTVYFWRGPAGFTSSDQSPVINSVTPANAGYYYLSMQDGNCISGEGSLFLGVVAPPEASISTAGSSAICTGQTSITLEVTNVADFSYQWKLDGSPIAGATGVTHDASQAGDYTVELSSNIAACTTETPAFTVNSVSPPMADFNISATACVGESIQLENISTTSQTPSYLWDFGDGSANSTSSDPAHIFDAAGTYDVTLTVNYGDATCQDIATKQIMVASSPTLTVSSLTSDDVITTDLCTGDSLNLKAAGTYTSITWSTTETTDSIWVKTSGEYVATVTNAEGCEAKDTVNIVELTPPVVTISADPNTSIGLGESVVLTASSPDGLSYSWTPQDSLDNPNIASPIATPDTTTTFMVEVTGTNGCVTISEILITVGIDLNPRKVFSPNGDGIDDDWVIGGILSMPECAVVIFDRSGRKVYESQPYNNDWRAQSPDGSELPAGPYYFIIKCNNEVAKTGSVLVVR